MHATPKFILLRRYGCMVVGPWEYSVENMIRVLDSFIKQFNVLAQFFKHGQMQCVVSASFRKAKIASNMMTSTKPLSVVYTLL